MGDTVRFSQSRLIPFLSTVSAVFVWELVPRSGIVSSSYLPPFSSVIFQFADTDFFLLALSESSRTLGRAMVGFFVAALLAIPVGMYMGRSQFFYSLLAPIVEFLRPLPASAIIPVALLFLGIGDQMKIAVIVFGCTWPVLVNTIEGAQNIDPILHESCKLLGMKKVDLFFLLFLPGAAPFIFSGLRTSLAVSMILSVTVEMLIGPNGLGFQIIDFERAFRIPEMYSLILLLGCWGFLLNYAFLRIQALVVHWKTP
jgi:NitT/TauT family transport system permease protein